MLPGRVVSQAAAVTCGRAAGTGPRGAQEAPGERAWGERDLISNHLFAWQVDFFRPAGRWAPWLPRGAEPGVALTEEGQWHKLRGPGSSKGTEQRCSERLHGCTGRLINRM